MTKDNTTLREHAEAWWSESGNTVPSRDTAEYARMYERWIEYAFSDQGASK